MSPVTQRHGPMCIHMTHVTCYQGKEIMMTLLIITRGGQELDVILMMSHSYYGAERFYVLYTCEYPDKAWVMVEKSSEIIGQN